MDLSEFNRFFETRVAPIPGWLQAESALLTAHLAEAQHARDVRGAVLEIGVFKGKYLSVLYRTSTAEESVIGVDLFVGTDDKAAVVEAVRSNIREACGDATRLRLVVADSRELDAQRLRSSAGRESFRFASIDGGHTRELVEHDLAMVGEVLASGGIIALDDAFNHTTPGVTEGLVAYFLTRRPPLAPFAHCYNKLFLTTRDHHEVYLHETWSFVERETSLAAHERTLHRRRENQSAGFTPTMFGYELVPYL